MLWRRSRPRPGRYRRRLSPPANTFEFNTDLHDIYDAAADAWRSLAPLPTARSGVAAAVLAGRLFVFGGERAGGVFIENEACNPRSDRWSTMTPMRTPRHGTGAAVVARRSIPAGGLTNWAAAPPPRTRHPC